MTKTRLAVFRLLLVALPLAVVALAIELVLPRVAPAARVAPHAWGNRPATRLPGVMHHAVTENFDVWFRANALGFNDVDHAWEKPAGTVRVLLLGDSFLEGYTVDPQVHLARVLEGLAARDGVRLEAIAMGVSGWGQAHQLASYEVVGRRFDPDVVVTFFCGNDLWNNRVLQDSPRGPVPLYELGPDGSLVFALAGLPETPPSPEEIARHERPRLSAGMRALRHLVLRAVHLASLDTEERRAARAAALYELPPEAEAAAAAAGGPAGLSAENRLMFEKLAARLASDVAGRDGRLLVNAHVTGNLREPEIPAQYRRLLAWVAETYARHGIESIDLERAFRERMRRDPRLPVFDTDPHWNPLGHAWAAAELWTHLHPHLARQERGQTPL